MKPFLLTGCAEVVVLAHGALVANARNLAATSVANDVLVDVLAVQRFLILLLSLGRTNHPHHVVLLWAFGFAVTFGAIEIILVTFSALFRPPPPPPTYVSFGVIYPPLPPTPLCDMTKGF